MTQHADDCDWHVDQYPWECTCGAIKPPLTRLYHQGPDGVLRELKRVSAEEFMGMDHTLKGIPVVYAVWPEEPSE